MSMNQPFYNLPSTLCSDAEFSNLWLVADHKRLYLLIPDELVLVQSFIYLLYQDPMLSVCDDLDLGLQSLENISNLS